MNPLALSDAEYRAIFERITQLTLEYLATLNRRPSFPGTSGSESDALFRKPLPEDGIGPKALDDLARVIDGARAGGPRFFGYVLGLRMPALSRRRCRAACVLTHRRLRQVVTDASIEL